MGKGTGRRGRQRDWGEDGMQRKRETSGDICQPHISITMCGLLLVNLDSKKLKSNWGNLNTEWILDYFEVLISFHTCDDIEIVF